MKLSADKGREAGQLWSSLRNDITWRLRRVVGVRFDFEDLAGAAVLRALDEFGCVPDADRPRIWKWLCRVAHHLVCDRVRAENRVRIHVRDDLDAMPQPDAEPSDAGQAGARLAALAAAARGLDRDVLRLLEMESSTNASMANELGVSERTVERARMRLREIA